MSSIKVTVNSTSSRHKHCLVMIVNCTTRYVHTNRTNIKKDGPAQFNDVPLGMYYIVVVPEGENIRHVRFGEIEGPTDHVSIKINLTAADPVARITAIVLVDGQRSSKAKVTIHCKEGGYEYKDCCMTNTDGEAVFHDVPKNHKYIVTARYDSEIQEAVCNLNIGEVCEKTFDFPG